MFTIGGVWLRDVQQIIRENFLSVYRKCGVCQFLLHKINTATVCWQLYDNTVLFWLTVFVFRIEIDTSFF